MIVVDTNLIGYLVIPGEQTEQAERVLTKDPDWVAPRLWRSELRNVLALYLRRRLLGLEDAVAMMDQAERLMAGREGATPSLPVLALAERSGRSAYDCEFVALASELGVRFVTADRQLVQAFPELAATPDQFLST
jgi:predicted nucleic acid-binding protein